MKNLKVLFFNNGNTAVFSEEQQVPELQVSWLKLFIKFLVEHGVDPVECTFESQSGLKFKPFRVNDSFDWNWEIES